MSRWPVPKLEQIIPVVCEAYWIPVAVLLGRERHALAALARQVAWMLAKRIGGMSLCEIANVVGRDHTSVLAGIVRVERLLLTCEPVTDRVLAIVDTLEAERRKQRAA